MTDRQPEGTQLVTQLGGAMGGPEVPDPETETVDLRRKLWNLTRLGESLAGSGNLTIRRCGEQVLAVLGDAALPVAAVLDRPTIDAQPSGEADLGDDTSRAPASAVASGRPRAGAVAGEGSGGSGEAAPLIPDVGHLTAADRALVAFVTGGGIRSREIQVEFADDDPGASWRERAEAAEGKLAEIEAYARAWAESAAATEWSGTVLSTTVLADAGRTILAITGTEGESHG